MRETRHHSVTRSKVAFTLKILEVGQCSLWLLATQYARLTVSLLSQVLTRSVAPLESCATDVVLNLQATPKIFLLYVASLIL